MAEGFEYPHPHSVYDGTRNVRQPTPRLSAKSVPTFDRRASPGAGHHNFWESQSDPKHSENSPTGLALYF